MTPLCLVQLSKDFKYLKLQDSMNAWQRKELHGRFLQLELWRALTRKVLVEWLQTGIFFTETEGFLFSIHDQLLKPEHTKKLIMGQKIDSRCHQCKSTNKSIWHICCGCPALV